MMNLELKYSFITAIIPTKVRREVFIQTADHGDLHI